MTIRKVQQNDYDKLVLLYRSFFKTHNIFQKSAAEIKNYLKAQAKENKLIVYEDKGIINGALYLVSFGQNADGSHKLWKFRHFAFKTDSIASKLLAEAEKMISKESLTSKIELTIAESEPGRDFYKANGYVQEASLSNHYRWGETCYVLGKSFPKK